MITVEMLKSLGACESELEVFEELFPEGTEVTEELCVRHALDFEWCWCSENLLSPAGFRKYNEVIEEAREEFYAVVNPSRQNYEINPNEYNRTKYFRILSQEAVKLEIAKARAFAKTYVEQ